ncbi:MAG TPA: hypothetical protein VGS07_30350 [Thermoanaerobaculia bacterium]|jgi:hypothetical protein|nr:hypothetical protein [Thermoanaerobaculia bacterium]
MSEIEKDVDALRSRVNKLENVAYILGGLAVVLGLAGASLFTKLWDAKKDVDRLQGKINELSQDINKNLGTKVDSVIRDHFKEVMNELGNPVVVYKVTKMAEVPVSSKTSTITLTCPMGTLPVGGGFKNPKSAVNLVQIFTEQRDLILSLDNTGTTPGESLVVDAWATCLKSTEAKAANVAG